MFFLYVDKQLLINVNTYNKVKFHKTHSTKKKKTTMNFNLNPTNI